MKKIMLSVVSACVVLTGAARSEQSVSVIPQPAELVVRGGLASTNVTIREARDATIPAEGYELDVGEEGVVIRSSDAAGAFYARQTLEQLVTDRTNYVCASVKDAPAYPWRGMLFDDCRHFFGKDVLKKTMDLMARYKMNVLHWHLTDDQGWRIDIPGHPELVRYGARRPASPRHGAKIRWIDRERGEYTFDTDGMPYGPYFYTEADIREILAYAAARQITVVPEVELPGHVYTVLAAHPELACRPEGITNRVPRLIWGVEKDVLCIGNDESIRFMEKIVDYVCRLFPSKVVHIGGDECPRERWCGCAKCQKRIRDEKLGDEKGLQPWITRHFVEFLAKRGKRAIGWDEYLLGEGIPPSAMGMSWRIGDAKQEGTEHAWLSPAELAAKGHDVVMTPSSFCYLDYAQGIDPDPFQYIGGRVPLEKCHSMDPCAGVAENLRGHILGGQGNNWSEYTWNQYDLEWKMWPRGCALAEVFWSGKNKPAYADFLRRMRVHRDWLLRQGVNCAPLE